MEVRLYKDDILSPFSKNVVLLPNAVNPQIQGHKAAPILLWMLGAEIQIGTAGVAAFAAQCWEDWKSSGAASLTYLMPGLG